MLEHLFSSREREGWSEINFDIGVDGGIYEQKHLNIYMYMYLVPYFSNGEFKRAMRVVLQVVWLLSVGDLRYESEKLLSRTGADKVFP